ncbi:hypothetical protein [Enterobacter ludwigii]|uniref:hypothetical protein n=1 Tax=Enterobacter ludwigii TaxID=299767 RepID=UPI0013D2C704|nr:hypothetical protein [Enterobacter ludwigii]
MKRQWLFAATLLAFSASSMAVDGYKNLKFGMSAREALATKTCSFRMGSSDQKGVDMYVCDDFKIGGQLANGYMFFMDKKLARFAFQQPVKDAISVLESIKGKYGEPINPPSRESLMNLDRIPNSGIDVDYDHGTVTVRFTSDERLYQRMWVMYSIPEYNQKMIDLKNAQISSDL